MPAASSRNREQLSTSLLRGSSDKLHYKEKADTNAAGHSNKPANTCVSVQRKSTCQATVQAPRLSTRRVERHAHRRMPAASSRSREQLSTSLLRGSSDKLHYKEKPDTNAAGHSNKPANTCVSAPRKSTCQATVQAPRLSTRRFERHAHRRMLAASSRNREQLSTSLLRGSSDKLHYKEKADTNAAGHSNKPANTCVSVPRKSTFQATVLAPRLSTRRFERHAHRRMPAASSQSREQLSTSLLRGSSDKLHYKEKADTNAAAIPTNLPTPVSLYRGNLPARQLCRHQG